MGACFFACQCYGVSLRCFLVRAVVPAGITVLWSPSFDVLPLSLRISDAHVVRYLPLFVPRLVSAVLRVDIPVRRCTRSLLISPANVSSFSSAVLILRGFAADFMLQYEQRCYTLYSAVVCISCLGVVCLLPQFYAVAICQMPG
jgi:hypothetical protein